MLSSFQIIIKFFAIVACSLCLIFLEFLKLLIETLFLCTFLCVYNYIYLDHALLLQYTLIST